jgi:uncharacterized membrane protein
VGEPRVVSSALSMAALAAGIGAAAMYLTDPARGRRRRALIRDQASHWARTLSEGMQRAARDTGARAKGAVAEARARMTEGPVDDHRLMARVRSALGRAVSNPGAIQVQAYDGVVTLTGVVLAGEVGRLMARVSGVRGVRSVDNQLSVREEVGATPGLQGARDRGIGGGGQGFVLPMGTGAAGLGLVALGLARRGPLGLASVVAGGVLAAKGLSGSGAGRALRMGGRGNGWVDVQKTITINRPLGEVFEFFRAYENFPRVMSRVREVRDIGEGRSHWVVAGPAGVAVEWDARTVRMDDDRAIAWKSEPGSMIPNSGTIRFEPAESGTRVHIRLCYHPPGGVLGHAAAMLFGSDPKSELDQDLMRAKVLIETGHPAHDAARPIGRTNGRPGEGR